jgi:hypothetical protein
MEKLSVSDYITAYAFLVLKESEGPDILNEIGFGR